MTQISPSELRVWLADSARHKPQLLDVREPWEFRTCRIGDSQLIPMREIPARIVELDPRADTVVICHHGTRSMQAAYFLERMGFESVFNLSGGVDAWARTVDPAMPVY
jgi:rhodanese-related sulfurtransferase